MRRLSKLVKRAPGTEYTFGHLLYLLQPSSPEALALILQDFEEHGLLERLFRVESPRTKGGLGDFRSIAEVPSQMLDRYTDEEINVEPRLVKPIVKLA